MEKSIFRISNKLQKAICLLLLWEGMGQPMALTCFAQQSQTIHLVDHKPLMNPVWETFDQLMYRVSKKDGKTIYTPHFPPVLARMNGKRVTIQGYMVPLKPGWKHSMLLLSVLPLYQCMFCGKDGIPAMTEIMMAYNTKITFSDEPITVKGTVFLNATDKDHAEIQLRDAVLVPKK